MVAMEAPHQGTARPLATVRPLAMEAPYLATARAQAMVRVPAMEAPLLTQVMAHPLLARAQATARPMDMVRAPTSKDQATAPQPTILIRKALTVTARAPRANHPIAAVSAATATVMTPHTE